MEFKKSDKYKLIQLFPGFTLGKIYECLKNKKYEFWVFDDWNNEKVFSVSYYVFSAFFEKINEEKIEYKNIIITTTIETHKCNCVIRDLLMHGCKCGGV